MPVDSRWNRRLPSSPGPALYMRAGVRHRATADSATASTPGLLGMRPARARGRSSNARAHRDPAGPAPILTRPTAAATPKAPGDLGLGLPATVRRPAPAERARLVSLGAPPVAALAPPVLRRVRLHPPRPLPLGARRAAELEAGSTARWAGRLSAPAVARSGHLNSVEVRGRGRKLVERSQIASSVGQRSSLFIVDAEYGRGSPPATSLRRRLGPRRRVLPVGAMARPQGATFESAHLQRDRACVIGRRIF